MLDHLIKNIKRAIKKIQLIKLRISLWLEIGDTAKKLKLTRDKVDEHKRFWSRICPVVNPKWFQVYTAISGVGDIRYVPEDIFYGIIEPKMNNKGLVSAHADKNLYEKYYSLKTFPKTLIRNIHGLFLNSEYKLVSEKNVLSYLDNSSKILIKPSIESSQGRNIEIFTKDKTGFFYNRAGDCLSIEYIKNRYKYDYLIQNYIEQHPFFAQFNKTSLNGLRILTYRSVTTNKITILGSLLKFGREGTLVDNLSAGGISIRIDEYGRLHNFATDLQANKYYTFANGRKFSEVGEVPKIAEIKELALKMAGENYHFRMLGFDICVDKDSNLIVIEVNNSYLGINWHQLPGKPLFGDFTGEVMDYCAKKG